MHSTRKQKQPKKKQQHPVSRKSVNRYSTPEIVFAKAKKYLGDNVNVQISTKQNKKYMVQTPTGAWVHFGQIGFEDFTKHQNLDRRRNYLNRSAHIRGNWKKNKYSPNNLARHLLW